MICCAICHPKEIERVLPFVRSRHLGSGEVLFHAGAPGDALYIVANGKVDVMSAADGKPGDGRVAGDSSLS